MLFLLLFAFQLDGEFYSAGPWPLLKPSFGPNEALVIPQADGYFIGNEKVMIPDMVEMFVDETAVYVLAQNVFKAVSEEKTFIFPFQCLNVTRIGDRIVGSLLSDPFLMVSINPKTYKYEKFFKRPNKSKGFAWAAQLGRQRLVAWNGDPGSIYITNQALEKHNADMGTKYGIYPIIKPWPRDPAPRSEDLKLVFNNQASYQIMQEKLSEPRYVYFANIDDGFLIARATGVKAPNSDDIYIGSKTEIRFYRKGKQVGRPRTTYGQIVGVLGGELVVIHHRSITESPLALWGTHRFGALEASVKRFLRGTLKRKRMVFEPILERISPEF